MSKYTTEVRFICETVAGLSESIGFSDVESVLEKSWDKIFSPGIPFYKEEKRSELCQKILAHYYTREIGFETVGLWKLHLNRKSCGVVISLYCMVQNGLPSADSGANKLASSWAQVR